MLYKYWSRNIASLQSANPSYWKGRAQALAWKSCLAICCILLLVWYAKTHTYRDPGSRFFDEDRAFEQQYSRHRKEEALGFITSYAREELGDKQRLPSRNTSLCVAVSSVKRAHTQYLETAIASLLQGLTPEERHDLHVTILFAETDPNHHPSWHQKWLHQVVDEMLTYNVSVEERRYLQKLEQTRSYAEKGVYDYLYALQHCYEVGSPYIGMFEDDILMADGWLVRTLLNLQKLPRPDERDGTWLFMRLFNQERSTGWASREIGSHHEHWIIVGIAIGISTTAMLARRRWRLACTYLDVDFVALFVVLLVPATVILFFQSGKASTLPPRPGVFAEPFGCCSQALVFPRTQVPLIVDYLQKKKKGQVDLLLNMLAREDGLTRYAMYPVQVQHIGLESARMTIKQDAQAIWSMTFEDLDPISQARKHGQMVQQYYGNLNSTSDINGWWPY